MINRSQVRHGSETMRYSAETAPSGATAHTIGVLNGRTRPGSRTRRNTTPTETITKARSVPIETQLPASRTVRSGGTNATAVPVVVEGMEGGWNFGRTVLTNGGGRDHRHLREDTREWHGH